MCMWDNAAKIMRYMHCEIGISDVQSKVRASILSADVDMDPDHVIMAMKQGLAEGLEVKAPEGADTRLPVAPEPETVAPELHHPPPTPVAPSECKPAVALKETAANGSVGTAAPDTTATYAELTRQVLAMQSTDTMDPQAQILQTLLLSQIAQANQKQKEVADDLKNKEKKALLEEPKDTKKPRVKTIEEKLWAECMAIGKKLEGMITHAGSIAAQTALADNDWYWARNEMAPLESVLSEIAKTDYEWNANVRTSMLGIMAQKLGSSAKCAEWLADHKLALESASAKLQRPLGELIVMHNARLRTREESAKPKQKTKAKAKAKAKS